MKNYFLLVKVIMETGTLKIVIIINREHSVSNHAPVTEAGLMR